MNPHPGRCAGGPGACQACDNTLANLEARDNARREPSRFPVHLMVPEPPFGNDCPEFITQNRAAMVTDWTNDPNRVTCTTCRQRHTERVATTTSRSAS